MRSVLRWIEDKYRSDDPNDRVFGVLGKIAVEGGLAVVVGVAVTGLIYVFVTLTPLRVEFHTEVPVDGYVGLGFGIAMAAARWTKCKIITEE